MPIYEYVCTACNKKFEVQRKFSDPPITTCAEFSCPEGEPVEKIISAPAIMFKGSGWYVTDYSDKLKDPNRPGEDGKPQGKSADGKTEGTTEGKTEGKSESNSETTAPAKTGESSSSTASSSAPSTSPSSGSSSSSSTTSSPPSSSAGSEKKS